MRVIKPSYEIWNADILRDALPRIERAARVAYKSEDRIDLGREPCAKCVGSGWLLHKYPHNELAGVHKCSDCEGVGGFQVREPSYLTLLRKLLSRDPPHVSVIEHAFLTVKIICDRGVTHELVRHRLASYTQESTRYCNYTKEKFGGEVTFIRPFFWNEDTARYKIWLEAMANTENAYLSLIEKGASAQEARSVLPNSLKTEIVVTANLREWRHIFKMRCDKAAHPQMREVMRPLWRELSKLLPLVFDGLGGSE